MNTKTDTVNEKTEELRKKSKKLFEEDEINCLLGWKYDSRRDDLKPAVFTEKENLDNLFFNERSLHNLVNYFHNVREKYDSIGIVLKGCDGRSLTTLLSEEKFDRDNIKAIAVECEGVRIDGEEPSKCSDCPTHISPVSDIIIGNGEKEKIKNYEFEELKQIEEMNPSERWEYFSEQFEKCSRCYACRQVCPLCYCDHCIAHQRDPKWIESSAKLSSNTMWNLTRAMHVAGRCADCGECERACPEDIPLRLLNTAVEKFIIEKIDVRPGTDPNENPPLTRFSEDDPESLMEGAINDR